MAIRSAKLPRPLLRPAVREEITGWLFVFPWVFGFVLFTAGPMLFSLYTSFTRYNIIRPPAWIGVQNYDRIFNHDPFFWKAVENTFWMVLVKTPMVIVGAIALALLLNMDLPAGRFFRTIIYLPNVLSGVAAIFLWQWILSPRGLFNNALSTFGIQGPAWFVDPAWTKPGMVVMGMWWIGGNVLIFLAALKGISKELLEAAAIDGAVGWNRLRFVVLPLLTPAIFFSIVTGIIGTFQIFTTAFILSGNQSHLGGPSQSMLFYVLYLYNRAFGRIGQGGFQMGYASGLAWILFLIILAITIFQLRLAKRWVFYEVGPER
jgi:multiple sugar transport system permease protein